MPDYRATVVNVTEIDRIWPSVAYGLEHACRKTGGDLTADYLWSQCRSGAAFLVVVVKRDIDAEELVGASVWRFEKWTTGKKLRCLALYGRGFNDWWPQHYKLLGEMLKAGQTTQVVWEGRKGFERLFKRARVLRQLYEGEWT